MPICSDCGDLYTERHECWVRLKTDTQEYLPAPAYEFVASRKVLTDDEWHAARVVSRELLDF